jgi:hypothetical protein
MNGTHFAAKRTSSGSPTTVGDLDTKSRDQKRFNQRRSQGQKDKRLKARKKDQALLYLQGSRQGPVARVVSLIALQLPGKMLPVLRLNETTTGPNTASRERVTFSTSRTRQQAMLSIYLTGACIYQPAARIQRQQLALINPARALIARTYVSSASESGNGPRNTLHLATGHVLHNVTRHLTNA